MKPAYEDNQEIRAIIYAWSHSLPRHSHLELDRELRVLNLVTERAYRVSVDSQFEERSIEEREEPWDGSVAPAASPVDIRDCGLWDFEVESPESLSHEINEFPIEGSYRLLEGDGGERRLVYTALISSLFHQRRISLIAPIGSSEGAEGEAEASILEAKGCEPILRTRIEDSTLDTLPDTESPEAREALDRLIAEARSEASAERAVLFHEVCVEAFPLTRLDYAYRGTDYRLWISGTDERVVAPLSPISEELEEAERTSLELLETRRYSEALHAAKRFFELVEQGEGRKSALDLRERITRLLFRQNLKLCLGSGILGGLGTTVFTWAVHGARGGFPLLLSVLSALLYGIASLIPLALLAGPGMAIRKDGLRIGLAAAGSLLLPMVILVMRLARD